MKRSKRQQKAAARRARLRRRQERRLATRRSPAAVLQALTTSALALPGLAPRASAESAPVEVQSAYRYSQYREDALPSGRVAVGGERDRYEIDIHQFQIEAPIGERFSLGLDLSHETMSGATPWYVQPGALGEDPVQVMTAATIDEARTDAKLQGNYFLDRGKASASAGFSIENDYRAIYGSLGGERSFNERNTRLSFGAGASVDEIEPVDTASFPTRPTREDKQSYHAVLGGSHNLSRSAALQSSVKFQHSRGYLSDPYKLSVVAGVPETDRRPDTRNQVAWLTRLRKHLRPLDASLHLDYQLSVDDWEIYAHTIELAWYQTLFDRVRIVPSFRYMSQSQAYFYAPFYTSQRADGLRSSDYRLSPFGAVSGQIKLETRFQTWGVVWNANIAWERYVSDGDYALESVSIENPGLVSYNLLSVGLRARF